MSELLIVFVHGYSVTNLETYGELPLRLRNEAAARNLQLQTEDIFLGRYISFSDEVKLTDVARALEYAVQQQIPKGKRFICITHSTGGPVVRTWWHHYYQATGIDCPISHLIMLAPANHGSALAQLGKTKLSRVRSWFDGLEPGQRILDWLELGSDEAWDLNKDWILNGEKFISFKGVFPFVITSQDLDRKLYDHVNSYTGEIGSDGAVRVASANINSRYLRLEQKSPEIINGTLSAQELNISEFREAPATPTRVIKNKSHSGDRMGIMRSVKRETTDTNSKELIDVVFKCIGVKNSEDYQKLTTEFFNETQQAQEELIIEIETTAFRKKLYIHDRYSMILFRVQDMNGNLLSDFDLVLTGDHDDPDQLPTGFFADRQCNHVNKNTITYFINYDVMNGCEEIKAPDGEVIRKKLQGLKELGLMITARPADGFVRFLPCKIKASKELFEKVLKPNSTTLIDIYLQRLVSDEVFRFEKINNDMIAKSFKDVRPGDNVVG